LLAALTVPGCDGVEFDVRPSADGAPILLHDATLDRVQGLPGRADELTVAELSAFGVPSLADVLAAMPPTAFLDVELKGYPGAAIGALVEVVEAGRGRLLERAVLSSFDPAALEAVRAIRPGWPRWLNAEDLSSATLRLALRLGCRAISAEWRAIAPATAAAARRAGLDLAAWTVRRRATVSRLERLGVVAVCAEAAALDG
jgi:glycerophosphoryl diester phosphodiesterase